MAVADSDWDIQIITRVMITDMEIITDTILISETIITGVMILSITITGTHREYSVSTSETDGIIIITVGMVITIMATIITDQITIQIMIIITITTIRTDILPQHILREGTRAPILNLPRGIMYPGGRYLLLTLPAML